MSQLSLERLESVAPGVLRPAYDPAALRVGVVHFGPGAFHRAHQAAYLDSLAASDPRWGICGVSLHSKGVREALAPQDGLYTLAVLDTEVSFRVIGALREVLVAPEDPEAVFERLTQPEVRIVTATVTEKGYCLTPAGELDLSHPDIAHDLENPRKPRSFIGYVAEGLRRRYSAGIAPFVLIACDNLPENGRRLKRAVVAFVAQGDAALAERIADGLIAPCTMVDSITPATDDALRERVREAIGFEDAWPIQREAFAQWVIEAHAHEGGPDWQNVGVIVTDSVPAWERAKLRLLNGAHSALAYIGLQRGHATVFEAMNDPELDVFVRRLMLEDIVPLLEAPDGFDLAAYAEAVMQRFRNPAIRHLLAQIAWDGSQKLPVRLLPSLAGALEKDRDISRFALAFAAWFRFVRDKAVSGEALTDPLADELIARGSGLRDQPDDVRIFLEDRRLFPETVATDPRVIAAFEAAYEAITLP